MKLLVISDAPILQEKELKVAYAPYVKEMDIWMEYSDSITYVCPNKYRSSLLTKPFKNQVFKQVGLRRLEFHTILSALISLITLPYQSFMLWNQMRKADHIHLRAPGNLCLLACFVAIFFPKKKKTAKYAGNWDPKAKQPLAYRIQKWILSNTFLIRNIQVLVYGEWKGATKNIKPFFTASYFNSEKEDVEVRDYNEPLKAVFVGTLTDNKRPYETVQLLWQLRGEGIDMSLDFFGEGEVRQDLDWYRSENGLRDQICLRGNQSSEIVKEAFKKAHFVILLSKSEGWPKVVAEAMFWGAIPIVSKVSCVPWMLGDGERGVLIDDVTDINIQEIKEILNDKSRLERMSKAGLEWSRQYTMDIFASEIKSLLK